MMNDRLSREDSIDIIVKLFDPFSTGYVTAAELYQTLNELFNSDEDAKKQLAEEDSAQE